MQILPQVVAHGPDPGQLRKKPLFPILIKEMQPVPELPDQITGLDRGLAPLKIGLSLFQLGQEQGPDLFITERGQAIG